MPYAALTYQSDTRRFIGKSERAKFRNDTTEELMSHTSH